MSYMNLREFCAFDFCMDIFRMSYMNLRELCMCLFCTYVFCMSYMYPQEVVCVISYVLHESTRILYVSILHMYFSYVLHESTKLLYVFSSYVLHESTRILFVSILHAYSSWVYILHLHFLHLLHVSTWSFMHLFRMSYMNLREYIICLFCMCFKLNFVCPTWTQKECGRKQLKLHGHVTGNNKSYRGCKELGTIIGPGEDKNRNMTSMSETRIKLSCNALNRVKNHNTLGQSCASLTTSV